MEFLGDFINGRFVKPKRTSHKFLDHNPGDLAKPLGKWCASKNSVEDAVEAAKSAFDQWSCLNQNKRRTALLRFAKSLKRHANELSSLITKEIGKPIAESLGEADRIVEKIQHTVISKNPLTTPIGFNMEDGLIGHSYFRPRGVTAILSPFNVPAYIAMSQAVTALYTGNTVVLKPSEAAPFTAQLIAKAIKEAQLSEGIINIVYGTSKEGRKLVSHPDVRMVFFTGSSRIGSGIQQDAIKNPNKLIALEMGGKNASIVLKDADLDNAINEIHRSVLMTSGQRCNATSRIILHKHCAKKFLSLFLDKIDNVRIGYGLDFKTELGPLASLNGFNNFFKLTSKADKEGFEILRRPHKWRHPSKQGYYLTPSVHLMEGIPRHRVTEHNYTDSEIFGPDAAIYIVNNIEEALAINNRPHYGLVTSVFTKSKPNFDVFLRGSETGMVNWNAGTVRSSTRLPFGGLKQSGNGRPAGSFAALHAVIPTGSVIKTP